MSLKRILLISLAMAVVLWVLFSWPLPRYCLSGIPAAAHMEKARVQPLIPGDHLQFLYHCWLAGDMLTGNTPFFYNLYEFNAGDDLARFQPGSYFVPFSIVYAMGSWLGGRAFGWNLTGFLSIWLTFLLTWLLTRRYASSDWISGLSAIVAVVLPYRWICMLGGSPTGFAMMWIPAIWLGIDLAVREHSVRGGILAGMAVLFSCWTDTHVFFFGVLTIPLWCVMALTCRTQFTWKRMETWLSLLRALLPVIILTILALLFPLFIKWLAHIKTGLVPAADMVGKRTLREIAIYSPHWKALFKWFSFGLPSHVYIGYTVPIFLVTGGVVLLMQSIREWRSHWRSLVIMGLLGISIMGIMALALGTRGPGHGALLRLCRFVIPPYSMIRQPAKIFCLMPSFLALASAIGLTALVNPIRSRAWQLVVPALCVSLIITEHALRVSPIISLLEYKQEAYAAVADDAASEGTNPHVLVLPLWPGDSHYSSIYQYFASLYRVRMVNGYNPFIKKDYFDNVFRRFESVNQGGLSDDQIEGLQKMNVGAILLHEDLFPEKVSPFPVTFTLKKLLNHPRLCLLKQDGRVWAFKIMPSAVEKEDKGDHWDMIGSARRWEAESCKRERVMTVNDPATGGDAFITLSAPGTWISASAGDVVNAPDLRWLVRARGSGTLSASHMTGDREIHQAQLPVQTPGWTWLTIPVIQHDAYAPIALKLALEQGKVDLDTIILAAGQWESPAVGQALNIPAPCFFHAGYIDIDQDSVVLLKDDYPRMIAFYGPKLPFEKGVYQVQFIFRTDAPEGTPLGQFYIKPWHCPPRRISCTLVNAGKPAVATFVQDDNLIMYLEFVFFANADMEIDRVILTRME